MKIVYLYECVDFEALYTCAGVYVVFRHTCVFVIVCGVFCVCVCVLWMCVTVRRGLVWWGGKCIDSRKWLQTHILNFSWKGRVFGDCKVSFLFPLGTHYSEWMDVKPRLEGLSLRSGLKLWLNTTRSTTLWIVRHCSPYVPLLLCCLLESNKKALVLCREVLARRGAGREEGYPLSLVFPHMGFSTKGLFVGKFMWQIYMQSVDLVNTFR